MSTRKLKRNQLRTQEEWDRWFEGFKKSLNQRQLEALSESSGFQEALRTLNFRKAEAFAVALKLTFAATDPSSSARRSRLMDQVFEGFTPPKKKR
jgi:hypothetical protein